MTDLELGAAAARWGIDVTMVLGWFEGDEARAREELEAQIAKAVLEPVGEERT